MNGNYIELTKGMARSNTRGAVLKKFIVGLVLAISLAATLSANAASFVDTGLLKDACAYHTATLLPNGKVLVAGGYHDDYFLLGDSPSYLLKTELYDPATEKWTATGKMNTRRDRHTATLLPNGMVLVAGGADKKTVLSQSELYDPVSETWTNTGDLNNARSDHTATLLANGKVLVVGGIGLTNVLSSAEIYDPATGDWTLTGSMVHGRYRHTATLLANGKVLVAGGTDGATASNSGVPLSSAELYDPATGTWTETSPLNTRRDSHTATLLPNGKVLVAGGAIDTEYYTSLASAELYDPASGTWTYTGAMVTLTPDLLVPGRFNHTANLLPNGQVLVTGGEAREVGNLSPLSSAELYDPVAGTWAASATLAARESHTATLLPNGKVLVAGGWNSFFYPFITVGTAELYVGTLTLTKPTQLSDGSFQFTFTGSTGDVFSVLATTNFSLPLTNWTELGSATEISPGQFRFTDAEATNYSQRFYQLRSP